MNKKYFWILVVFYILVQCCILGCGNTQADYSAQVAIAQKNVPFRIVVPTYLPPNMKNYPISISPPDKGTISDNSIIMGIRFAAKDSNNYILIYEESEDIIVNDVPSYYEEHVYLDINGIKVLEEKAGGFTIVENYDYNWNQNGVHFKTEIAGNNQAECRKVVESMVKQ
jgi:hypothetical protein